jgi:hypothetical protein
MLQMTEEKKLFSGVDLAEKIIEFIAMTPDSNQWNARVLYDNPSRQIRFYQIQSLMLAFIGMEKNTTSGAERYGTITESKPSIKYFLNGDFIRNRTQTDYIDTVEFIRTYMAGNVHHDHLSKDVSTAELAFIFPKLFNYKTQLQNLLTFNSGWLEASSMTSYFSIFLTDSISQNLIGKYEVLDRALEWFINPLELSFTLDELIISYGYPKENLSDIDMNYY